MNTNIHNHIQDEDFYKSGYELMEKVIEKFEQLNDKEKMYIIGLMNGILFATTPLDEQLLLK